MGAWKSQNTSGVRNKFFIFAASRWRCSMSFPFTKGVTIIAIHSISWKMLLLTKTQVHPDAVADSCHASPYKEARKLMEFMVCLEPKSGTRPVWKAQQDAVRGERKRGAELSQEQGCKGGCGFASLHFLWKQGDFQHSQGHICVTVFQRGYQRLWLSLLCKNTILDTFTHWELSLMVIVLNTYFQSIFAEFKSTMSWDKLNQTFNPVYWHV